MKKVSEHKVSDFEEQLPVILWNISEVKNPELTRLSKVLGMCSSNDLPGGTRTNPLIERSMSPSHVTNALHLFAEIGVPKLELATPQLSVNVRFDALLVLP